jgi:hypothetical protein
MYPVGCSRWYVYRRTHRDRTLFTVEDYNSRASDDKPMFRPVRVSLIAESLTWAHDDPLYLVPGFVIQDQIPSPGPLVAFSYRHSPRLADRDRRITARSARMFHDSKRDQLSGERLNCQSRHYGPRSPR